MIKNPNNNSFKYIRLKTAFKRECYTFIIGPGSPKDGGKGFKKTLHYLIKYY